MITAFNDKVKAYLKKSGRSQAWLIRKMEASNLEIAPSTMCQKIKGYRTFTGIEVSVIKSIMKKNK